MSQSTIVSENMQILARGIEDALTQLTGEKIGFTLLVYTDGRVNYISNCDRDKVIEQMRNLIASWDAGLLDIPAHLTN